MRSEWESRSEPTSPPVDISSPEGGVGTAAFVRMIEEQADSPFNLERQIDIPVTDVLSKIRNSC